MNPCAPKWTVHGNIYARSMRTDLSSLQEPPPALAERLAQGCGIIPPSPVSWAARGELPADNLTLRQRSVESRSLLLRDAVKAHTVWENRDTEAIRRDPEKERGFVVGSTTVRATQPGSVWARRDSFPRSSPHTLWEAGALTYKPPNFFCLGTPSDSPTARSHVSRSQNPRPPKPPPPLQSQSGSIASSAGARNRQK